MKWRTTTIAALAAVAAVGCGDDNAGGEDSLASCDDGTDNDGDGYTDCDDQDCLIFTICTSADADADADADAAADADAPDDVEVDAAADAEAEADVEAEADSPTVCAEAPGCDGAATPGTIETPLESLVPSEPPAGCDPTKLRVRLASITVHDGQDAPETDEIYCVTSADAPAGAEIRLLPLTAGLSDGDSFAWPLEAGVLWGQTAGPAAAGGSLEIVIDCLEQDDPTGLTDFASRLGDEAVLAGGAAGSSGWVLPAGSDAAAVVAGTPWPTGDDHEYSVTLTLEQGVQFAATHGAWTGLRRTGGSWPNEWDWEVRLEVWGCTEDGIL
jgi:hypothetical protein